MLRQDQLANIVDSQKEDLLKDSSSITRESLDQIPDLESFATLVTGIRRCGKSTLLQQLIRQKYHDAFFLNFEDIRLAGFDVSDFSRLYDEIVKRKIPVLLFDEPQITDKWEIFVNQLLREKYKVFITGSNATLLSKELGTHLTGRNLSFELFPFSYNEFLIFKGLERNPESLDKYLTEGGMPEFLRSGMGMVLNRLIDDILTRDIAMRHSVRNIQILRQLIVYLFSNVGNLISANNMAGMFGIKSVTTFLEYFSYLSDAYLVAFIPQFNWSVKAQARNPKKIYAIDTGFITEAATLFTENLGARFENLVFLHLRRKYDSIYYFREKQECDFVAFHRNQPAEVVQACYQVDEMNFDREFLGIAKALKYFNMGSGTIVTFNQKDTFNKEGLTIRMVPAWEYLV